MEFTLSAEAERLVEPVREILSLVERTIEQRPEFDPGTNTCALSISASDYATLVLLSPFVRAVAAEAPGVTIYTLHMVSRAPTTSPPTWYEPSPTAPPLEPGRGANGHRGLPCRRAR
ncbi:hypothetical protein OG585_02165 [Streptomyces sp. NBC_01340]|uniref:hypothetical protein n=1 Tax=unclassified Streptomyces TaxID=2593676 RepID=UPI00224D9646|nr:MULTISPECIES: hypothetical protein [unclassified Streptomyces]MCX4461955.1 hypothetical protein [Streptomyces sp. NBC_01719]MCX4490863.1 hypothetical protein [Streptomyces sp. NBC_01728]MCX4594555.1 hypothetical protein [Streptomyces sp. NBC_01549]WSI36205.1 hypothetical protein OG585_02165 [Streptomyces sp. NBC_01340]